MAEVRFEYVRRNKMRTIPLTLVAALSLVVGTGCRDKQPEGPPPSGLQAEFNMGFRTLEGKLAAPPEDVARAGLDVMRGLGLVSVTRHTSPMWFAVVSGRKPGMPPTNYEIKVRGADDFGAFVEVSVGLSGDEGESRMIVDELARQLNLATG
jgi:hypothetical protein